jgi:hypothetical protein
MPIIPTLGRRIRKEFKASSLGYIVRPYLKKPK